MIHIGQWLRPQKFVTHSNPQVELLQFGYSGPFATPGRSRVYVRVYSVKQFHAVRRTASSAAANRFQLSSSVPRARLPAAVIR